MFPSYPVSYIVASVMWSGTMFLQSFYSTLTTEKWPRGSLFHEGKLLGYILSGICPVSYLEGTRVTVTANSCLDNNLILSFCGNLLFRSVFLPTVTLIRLLIQYFRLSYISFYRILVKIFCHHIFILIHITFLVHF